MVVMVSTGYSGGAVSKDAAVGWCRLFHSFSLSDFNLWNTKEKNWEDGEKKKNPATVERKRNLVLVAERSRWLSYGESSGTKPALRRSLCSNVSNLVLRWNSNDSLTTIKLLKKKKKKPNISPCLYIAVYCNISYSCPCFAWFICSCLVLVNTSAQNHEKRLFETLNLT